MNTHAAQCEITKRRKKKCSDVVAIERIPYRTDRSRTHLEYRELRAFVRCSSLSRRMHGLQRHRSDNEWLQCGVGESLEGVLG